MQRSISTQDSGFTLVELTVTLSVVGIMSGIAATSFSDYAVASEHRGARDEVVSTLRNAAERALAEGRAYCVHYEARQWTTYRFACTSAAGGVVVNGPTALDAKRPTLAPSITVPTGLQNACPTTGTCAYFYPRGNAAPGTVQVSSEGRTDYTVTIVGLTSRVYTS